MFTCLMLAFLELAGEMLFAILCESEDRASIAWDESSDSQTTVRIAYHSHASYDQVLSDAGGVTCQRIVLSPP